MIAQSVIFSVSLSEESSFWLKSLCDFSGQITDNYKSFCLAVLTGKASLPTPDLVHSPWIMALGTLRGLQSKPQAPWLARLFIFTFLVPSGFIWAFGQGSPSGSSAGVSWGLRRGNFRVISQSNSVSGTFPFQALLLLLPLHPLPSSCSTNCRSPPQSFLTNVTIPNLCWSIWSTRAPVCEGRKDMLSPPFFPSQFTMKWHCYNTALILINYLCEHVSSAFTLKKISQGRQIWS